MRTITTEERRARLARRHRLAPAHRARDVETAARSVVGLHATDPATVYLSAWARVDALSIEAMDKALYVDRTLAKQLAMRRTLFVVPRDLLAAAVAGPGARVRASERRVTLRAAERAGVRDPERWLARAETAVLEHLADGREVTSTELRQAVADLDGTIRYGGPASRWAADVPIAPRILTGLNCAGLVIRAGNRGGWTVSRPRWALTRSWLGEDIAPVSSAEGYTTVTRRWLRAFGPGTVKDLQWWLGATVAATRQALADVGAVEVDLEGRRGYVLVDDLDAEAPVEPWAALLPALDPTPMGWAERDWFLGQHVAAVFDRNGNAGPTAWWDGRVVGGWRHGPSGEVQLQLLEDVGSEGRAALDAEAERLTRWLGGVRVLPRFPSPLMSA